MLRPFSAKSEYCFFLIQTGIKSQSNQFLHIMYSWEHNLQNLINPDWKRVYPDMDDSNEAGSKRLIYTEF